MKSLQQFFGLFVGMLLSMPSFSQLSKSQAIDSLMINVVQSDSINYNVLLYPELIHVDSVPKSVSVKGKSPFGLVLQS